jgi:hypothetical protein
LNFHLNQRERAKSESNQRLVLARKEGEEKNVIKNLFIFHSSRLLASLQQQQLLCKNATGMKLY